MSQQETISGHKAQQKYHQDCKCHHHCSSFSAGTSWNPKWQTAQGPDNFDIRHHCDKQGQEEEEANEGDEIVLQPENVV